MHLSRIYFADSMLRNRTISGFDHAYLILPKKTVMVFKEQFWGCYLAWTGFKNHLMVTGQVGRAVVKPDGQVSC